MKIFDTHTHLYFPAFDDIREAVIKRNQQFGVEYEIQIGCDEISSLAALEMAKQYPHYYCTLGLHPTDVHHIGHKTKHHRYSGFETYQPQAQTMEALFLFFENIFKANQDLVVGFGETGFDLYHEDSSELLERQKKAFLGHIRLAQKYDRPLVIHSRSARAQTLDFMQSHIQRENLRGVFHCFGEDVETAKTVTEKYGFHIGIGGVATYKNAENVRSVIREIPLEFLLTETDAPFLVPHGYRKQGFKTNESAFLSEVIELIAELKGMDQETCAHRLYENAVKFFRIAN